MSARLELPTARPTHQFAIFAHCFTCGKNARAATIISRELTNYGIGVLRFDFTGIGMSEGAFEETNFTSNISDIESAASFLRENYRSPQLLIGHSLGGTAVLHASERIDSVKAICTIGAPFEAEHVLHHFEDSREEIEEKKISEVNIGGRPFKIGVDFIKDVESKKTEDFLPRLKKALLIMHSPQDSIVSIDNAAHIYSSAHHPKSFFSLNGADHLLTDKNDATYASEMIGTWVSRYLDLMKSHPKNESDGVRVILGKEGFTSEVVLGKHHFLADEPEDVGGSDLGPSPYQLLNASLGTCTAMTIRMYSDRKQWLIDKIVVDVTHEKVENPETSSTEKRNRKIDVFRRNIRFEGNLDTEQRTKLLSIANKCPVHRTLSEGSAVIETEVVN